MKRSYDVRTRNRAVSNLGEGFSISLMVCFPMHDTRATAARTIFVGRSPNAASVPGGSCAFFCDASRLCVFRSRKECE